MKNPLSILISLLLLVLALGGCEMKPPLEGMPPQGQRPPRTEKATPTPTPVPKATPAPKVTPVPTPQAARPVQPAPGAAEPWRIKLDDPAASWASKVADAYAATEKKWTAADYSGAMGVLAALYAKAPGQPERMELEKSFRSELKNYPLDVLNELSAQVIPNVSEADRLRFPYLQLRYETAVKRLTRATGQDKNATAATLKELQDKGEWADSGAAGRVALAPETPAAKGGSVVRAAMLLPLTGSYSDVGWKVARGVWAAQRVLASSGRNVEIEIVNTDYPNWQEALSRLDRDIVIVGGPLQINVWKPIMDSGAYKSRAFFTFLPDLGTAQEGVQAWRFFGGLRDQMHSLVETAADDLGVKKVAIFYPRDRYGSRLSQLFTEAATAKGMTIVGLGAYRQDDPSKWGENVAEFLKVPVRADKKKPVRSKLDAEVLFMPNSWHEAAQIVPQFYYYDATDMLFFGPGLWSQTLPKEKNIEDQYYRNALTPAPFWPEANTPGAITLRKAFEDGKLGEVDFWSALGFDFARFVGALGPLPAGATPAVINQRLATYPGIEFSQAPLVWDKAGQVSQRFFLMRPSSQGGLAQGDIQELRRSLDGWRATKKK